MCYNPRGDNMDKSYKIFDRYMELGRYKYNKKAFCNDDMYFCKTFKAHRRGFSAICDKHKCMYAVDILEDRLNIFEKKIEKMRQQ